jgi:DNA polymerase elongation subunit (family B)
MTFKLVNADTDSITICKPDGSPFSEEEQKKYLEQLNALFPSTISWEDDGYYKKVVVLKAKNYITQTQKDKVKIKGSALKATSKSPAMKEMINRIIQSILDNKNDFQDIYHEYIKEACNVKDIKRWSSRKTISEKTLNSQRTNESKIRDAIEGTEIVEGDRCWLYFDKDDNLKLAEQFDGNYNVDKLLQNCYDTIWVFESILDCDTLFKNFKLKRNKKDLEVLLNG